MHIHFRVHIQDTLISDLAQAASFERLQPRHHIFEDGHQAQPPIRHFERRRHQDQAANIAVDGGQVTAQDTAPIEWPIITIS